MVHKTAVKNAKLFFDAYVAPLGHVTVVEIGSQDVNGSIRPAFGDGVNYVGVDFAAAKGVDVVLEDPYTLPFADNEIDVIVSSSCFEQSEFFWLTFVEGVRILRPGGVFYLNAPSNGPVHGYPVDCWRFYPDAGRALAKWAVRQGHDVVMLESFTTPQDGGFLNDYVAIFLKDSTRMASYPKRMIDTAGAVENGYVHGSDEVRNKLPVTEDQRVVLSLQNYLKNRLKPV